MRCCSNDEICGPKDLWYASPARAQWLHLSLRPRPTEPWAPPETAPAPQKQKQGLICFKNNWRPWRCVYSWGRCLHGVKLGYNSAQLEILAVKYLFPNSVIDDSLEIKTWETSKCCAWIFICRLQIKITTSNQLRANNKSRVSFNDWWSCWPREPDTGSLFPLHVPGWIWWALQKMSMTRPQKTMRQITTSTKNVV